MPPRARHFVRAEHRIRRAERDHGGGVARAAEGVGEGLRPAGVRLVHEHGELHRGAGVGHRAQGFEAAEMGAEQQAAAAFREHGLQRVQALDLEAVAFRPAGGEEDAVEDGGGEGEPEPEQVAEARAAAERAAEIGAGVLPLPRRGRRGSRRRSGGAGGAPRASRAGAGSRA